MAEYDFEDNAGATSSARAGSSGSYTSANWDNVSTLVGNMYQNQANKRSAQRQMNFQQDMSNTSWQRGVADMIAAGVNPMLAVMKGGASSEPGAMHKAEAVTGSAVHSGQAGALIKAQTDKMTAETRNVSAEADRNEVIASVLKAIGPRVVQGVGAAESGAGALGRGVAEVEAIIRDALGGLPDIPGAVRGVVNQVGSAASSLGPHFERLIEDLRGRGGSSGKRPMMPPAVKEHHSAWGIGEYERAQAERSGRARSSPASRRRGGN